MNRYTVTGHLRDRTTRSHVIAARSSDAAEKRWRKAHPKAPSEQDLSVSNLGTVAGMEHATMYLRKAKT